MPRDAEHQGSHWYHFNAFDMARPGRTHDISPPKRALLMRPAILKKHNSLPDVSQALGSTSKTKSKKPKSFSDMMIMSFNDEEFINSVAPKICHIIQPLIEQTIKASVTAAVETAENCLG